MRVLCPGVGRGGLRSFVGSGLNVKRFVSEEHIEEGYLPLVLIGALDLECRREILHAFGQWCQSCRHPRPLP